MVNVAGAARTRSGCSAKAPRHAAELRLEPKLAVRGLTPALAGMSLFFVQQVNRRRRDRFVDITAAEASTVRAVPVSLDDHRATAAGAGSGQCAVHEGILSGARKEPCARPTGRSEANGCGNHAPSKPTGLAVGFGLEGCPTGRRPRGRRPIHPLRDAEGWFPRPPEAPPRTPGRLGCSHLRCLRAPSPNWLRRVCDFVNIVRPKPLPVNSFPANRCDFVRCDPAGSSETGTYVPFRCIARPARSHSPPYSSVRRSSRIAVPSSRRRRGL